MSELEQIRLSLHQALASGRPREEILQVSRRLDELIVEGMKPRTDRIAACDKCLEKVCSWRK